MSGGFPYVIDVATGVVKIQYNAPVTSARWRGTLDRVLGELPRQGPYRFLGDRTGVHDTPSRRYAENLVRYAQDHAERLRGSQWAHVLAPRDVGAAGIAGMIEALVAPIGIDVRVFTDPADALAWLTAPAVEVTRREPSVMSAKHLPAASPRLRS